MKSHPTSRFDHLWAAVAVGLGLTLMTAPAQQQPVFPGTEETSASTQPVFPGTEDAPKSSQKPAFPGTEEERPQATSPEIIAVTETEKLRGLLKQQAYVRGEVREISTGRSGYKRVHFTDSDFILYLAKRDLDRFPEWQVEEWKGKILCARGQVAEYRGQLELLIKAPTDLAATPEALASAAAESPESSTKKTPHSAAAADEPKKTKAELSQILARLDVPQPYLAFERFSGTLETGYRTTAPITLESYSGRDRSPAIAGVEAIRALGGWPQRKVLRVTRAVTDGAPGPGLPHSLAVAMMVESMKEGFELIPALAVGGRVQMDGTLTGGRDEIMLLPTPLPPKGSILLVPETAQPALIDLALDEQWEALTKYSILGAKTFAEAIRLARHLDEGSLADALERYSALVPELAANPASMLRSASVRSRLEAVVAACPEHLTARTLLQLGTAPEAPRYSGTASALKLRLFYAKLADTRLSKAKTKEDETRKKLRDLKSECRTLGNKVDSRWEAFYSQLKNWLDAMEDDLKFSASDDSPRAKKSRREVGALAEQAKKSAEAAAKATE